METAEVDKFVKCDICFVLYDELDLDNHAQFHIDVANRFHDLHVATERALESALNALTYVTNYHDNLQFRNTR